jgi:RHS repeat-associated protein
MLRRAVRTAFNTKGWVDAVARGTVECGASTPNWGTFSSLEQLNITHDTAGRTTAEGFAAGGATHALTQYSYDAASRLDCVAVRMNPATFASPPAACTLATEGTNGPDRISRNTYGAADRLTQVTSAYGTSAAQATMVQTYTNNGQIGTLRDANTNLTTYEYDGHDRVRRIRFPNASGGGSSTTDYEQYSYDANSNVTQDRRRDGATITYAYDNLNRASTMTPSTGAAVSYVYDLFSRMTQASFSGHTQTFGYDQLSRNASAGGPQGTVGYEYDLAGRRTRITWPGAPTFYVQYDYDLTGAVTAIRENGASSGAGVLATYAYDNLGRRTSMARAAGAGATTTYDYDAAGRLEELVQNLAATANDQTYAFTYSASSQAIARVGSNAAYVWPQPSPGVANAAPNGLNQIASLNGTNFTYDGRGNLTGTGSATYSYDVYNRLTAASTATLAYDAAGRLHQTVGGGVTTRFLYDGADLIAEYDGAGALLRRYVHGPDIDEPIVWYEGSSTSDRRWLHQDRLGSVIAASDSNGAIIGSPNTYDEYGAPSSSNAGRFQYTGQTWLPEANLYHYKARVYSPSLGRFLQSDPVLYAAGMNLYAYVGNDPVNSIDPLGLQDTPTTTVTGSTPALTPEQLEVAIDAALQYLSHWDRISQFLQRIQIGSLEDVEREALHAATCSAFESMMAANSMIENQLRGLPGNATYSRLSVTAIVPTFGAGATMSTTRYTHDSGGMTYVTATSFNGGWASSLPTTIDEFARQVLRGGGSIGMTYGIANNPSTEAGVGASISYRGGYGIDLGIGSSWEIGLGAGFGASLTMNFSNVTTETLDCP